MNEFFQNHTVGLIFFLMPCIVPVLICLICGLCRYDFKCCSDQSTSWDYHRFDIEEGQPELPSSVIAILPPGTKPPQTQDSNKEETEEILEEYDFLYSRTEESKPTDLVSLKVKELERILDPDA